MLEKLFRVMSANWLIHQDTVISYMPAIIAFLNGFKFDIKAEDDGVKPSFISFSAEGSPLPATCDPWDVNDHSIPENSVAIIPIDGPIRSWYTAEMIGIVRAAAANPQINALLFPVDSPGGMISQLDILCREIKECGKPTVAVVTDMAASAAMWLMSAMNYRIATSVMDQVGSIGVMTSISDMTVLMKEKLGINITEIYASKSTEKNDAIRAFLKDGNTTAIEAKLDFINEIFHAAIRDNLGIAADSKVFAGNIYFAEEAKSLGLINEINTHDYALNYAYSLGIKSKIKSFSQSFI
jgi:ClpP class serine protease